MIILTCYLGLTNTVTAIKNAQMAESPLLLLGGCAANLSKGRGALQDIDHMSLFKSICKYTVSIKRVREIPSMLRQAIHVAQSGTPGKQAKTNKGFFYLCRLSRTCVCRISN